VAGIENNKQEQDSGACRLKRQNMKAIEKERQNMTNRLLDYSARSGLIASHVALATCLGLAVASLPLDLATAGACHTCPRPFAGDDLGTFQRASNPDCQGQSPATTYTFQTVDFQGKDFNNSFQITWVNDAGLIHAYPVG
jgi:hypothetical protein